MPGRILWAGVVAPCHPFLPPRDDMGPGPLALAGGPSFCVVGSTGRGGVEASATDPDPPRKVMGGAHSGARPRHPGRSSARLRLGSAREFFARAADLTGARDMRLR